MRVHKVDEQVTASSWREQSGIWPWIFRRTHWSLIAIRTIVAKWPTVLSHRIVRNVSVAFEMLAVLCKQSFPRNLHWKSKTLQADKWFSSPKRNDALFPPGFLWLIAIKNKCFFSYPFMRWKESIEPETLSSRQEESWLWQITTVHCSCCLKPCCRLSSIRIRRTSKRNLPSYFPRFSWACGPSSHHWELSWKPGHCGGEE